MFAIWTNMEKKDCESKNVTDFDTELYHSLSPTVFFARLLWTKTPGLQQARSSLLIKMFSFYLDMWKTCPGYCNLYTFSVLSRSWTNWENSPTRFYQYCEDDIVRTPKFFAYILSAGAMFLSCISAPTLQWSHKLDLLSITGCHTDATGALSWWVELGTSVCTKTFYPTFDMWKRLTRENQTCRQRLTGVNTNTDRQVFSCSEFCFF